MDFYGYLDSLNEFKFDFSLLRVKKILRLLGNPQNSFGVIHITGSNGKGSTAAFLAAVFSAHGLKTGLYTSPHLLDVRERIALDGSPVEKTLFEKTGVYLKNLAQKNDIKLTYFEFLTVMAFMIFKKEKAELAVMEVGLGGRYDATNVDYKNKLLSIITSISLEHTDYLGHSRMSILKEKEQIIGKGVCVAGIKDLKLRAYLKKKYKKKMVFTDERYAVSDLSRDKQGFKLMLLDKLSGTWLDLAVKMPEPVQAENVMTALTALDMLKERFELECGKVQKAIAQVSVPGRMSFKNGVYLSVAHNPEAVEQMLKALALAHPGQKVTYVFSALKDKDVDSIMKAVSAHKNISMVITAIKDNPRAMATDILAKTAKQHGIHTTVIEGLGELKKFVNKNRDSGIMVIGGSFYLVKEFI